ncbi:MAG: chemotaxis protein CheD [Pirellulales bacterium]|nr:chemotaxis protein CheD [Pirellulales bacterium]
MSSGLITDPLAVNFVGMGEAAVARKTGRLMAVLGSCVGVTLYDPRRQLGALCHVVLPQSNGRDDLPGKFADTAIPWMVRTLAGYGASSSALAAKLVGGAQIFQQKGPIQIGEANVGAVLRALESAAIPVVARDVGGTHGRRMCFDVASGEIAVESAVAAFKMI